EIVQPAEIGRAAERARESEIIVIADDAEVVQQFARAAQAAGVEIRMLVDVDVRLGRTGVPPGEPARNLAREIAGARGLRFMGLMGYEGSMLSLDAGERAQACRAALEPL